MTHVLLVFFKIITCNFFIVGGSIAVNKPTSQSDTLDNFVSARAVDGNTDFRFDMGKSCSSTTNHLNPWWRVDLEKIESVSEVFIQLREECCKNETTKFIITIGKSNSSLFFIMHPHQSRLQADTIFVAMVSLLLIKILTKSVI